MKNILGHDNESEIITIIARLREKNFNIISYNEHTIDFDIILTHRTSVPVSNTRTQKIRYTINKYYNNDIFDYYIKQLNGIDKRFIAFSDGYIIWSILDEMLIK